MKYLTAAAATAIDVQLMDPARGGFALSQLMELAGLSVAECAYKLLTGSERQQQRQQVLVVCGPGNNGGDGLVAARHLHHFGFDVQVVLPKPAVREPFVSLVVQVAALGIPVAATLPSANEMRSHFGLVVDAVFGFSFARDVREPYAAILSQLKVVEKEVSILSVDVPSGWHVEQGNVSGAGLEPTALISLTGPKECARFFTGRHFLGGRFVPPQIQRDFGVEIAEYVGAEQSVELFV
ncbi:NAD(P)H-hydrate epimerase [Rhizoclosmatium sp. JEL0117]|nr:NAD(P)H-hydrate epimerase [Rhizoclosmatium sp. JEL0117]